MDNILDSYASDNVPILVGRFIIAIALCFTFPLYVGLLLASHAGLQRSRGRDEDLRAGRRQGWGFGWLLTVVEYWKMAIVTVAYVLFSSLTALFLDSLYTVVAMTGALGGSLIEAIIPAALYIKYVKEIHDVDAFWKTIYGWFFIILGSVIAVLGTYESIVQ